MTEHARSRATARRSTTVLLAALPLLLLGLAPGGLVRLPRTGPGGPPGGGPPGVPPRDPVLANAAALLEEGRRTFREDTFGDEALWGGTLRLHEAIAGEALGGVGPGVSPRTALAVGLKADAEALPPPLRGQLRRGEVDLDDPATTLALLELDAVVGVTGFFDGQGRLSAIGIQCALCHSTVDDALAPGIGRRLDGWANRDLNVGAIIDLSPDSRRSPSSSRSTRRRCARWCSPGDPASSTRRCCSTGGQCAPTAHPPRRSSRPPTGLPA